MGKTLPDKAQRALIRAKLNAGSILHFFCNFVKPAHNKFMVVVHVDYNEKLILVFLINSKIHPLIEKVSDLRACQIPLSPLEYQFLDHDSYLDCSKVFDDIEIEEVIDSLIQFPHNYKGHLKDKEILEIIQAVNSAPTITEYDKNLIIASLGQ